MDNVPTFSEQPNREVSAPSGVTRLKPPVVAALVLYAPMRRCKVCCREFPRTGVYYHGMTSGTGRRVCKFCVSAERKAKYATDEAHRQAISERVKKYRTSEEGRKGRREYLKSKTQDAEWVECRKAWFKEHGQRPETRARKRVYFQEYYEEHRDELLQYQKDYMEVAENEEKVRRRNAEYRRRPGWAARQRSYKQQYYSQHREELLAQQKQYRLAPENEARRRQWKAEYSRRPEVKEKAREYWRNVLRRDPQRLVATRLRGRVRDALKRTVKAGSTVELVGCECADLVTHLKSTMTPDMTVADFKAGRLHIDHIKPCASFDLTDPAQQKECFHFSNLQLLWAEDNLSKGAKDYEAWLALKEK
jgi:hypothetical protein